MAYGDRLWVRVRGTGDFRFETRQEDAIEEVGIVVNDSIELDMDDLHTALELDTRGIAVRQFEGRQRYVDAGADSAALDFVVNVAANVAVLGLNGTLAYITSRVQRKGEGHVERRVAALRDVDYETVARQAIRSKFIITDDQMTVDSVECNVDGKGTVELSLPADGRRFKVDLELRNDSIRFYRIKRSN